MTWIMGTLYMRNLRQFPRIPTVLVFGIAMPVIQLLLFGNLFSFTGDNPQFQARYPGIGYIDYITPAILMLTAFLGMANSAAALIVDLRTGYFDKLRTTPAHPVQVIIARLMAEMTRVSGQALIILGIAMLLGAQVATGIVGAIGIIMLAVVFSALTVGLFVSALALKTRSDQATQSAFPLFFILIFLSSAYVPKELMSDTLQSIVGWNPLDYLINALRSLMLEDWPWTDIGISLAAAAVLAVLLGFLNRRIYQRSME